MTTTEPTTDPMSETFSFLADPAEMLALRSRTDALVAELEAWTEAVPSIVERARECEAATDRLVERALQRVAAWVDAVGEVQPDKDLDQAVHTITRVLSGVNRVWNLLAAAADEIHPDQVFDPQNDPAHLPDSREVGD